MCKLRWLNDTLDNLYCFDIDRWALSIHPTNEGEWLAYSYREGKIKFSRTFVDLEEAKEQAIKFATTYKE